MPEWPDELLRGLDAPRPLGADTRRRLESALLEAGALEPAGGRPLGDELAARLEGTLLDDEDDGDVAAALAGIDGPRPLPGALRDDLTGALTARRRRLVPIGAAAAALVLVAGVGVVLAEHGSSPTVTAQRPSLPHRDSAGTSSGAAGSGGSFNQSAGAGSAVAGPLDQAASTTVPSLSPTAAPAMVVPTVTGLRPDRGPAGTVVTITGQGLAGATSVRFGTENATFTVVSDTELRATAPPGSGTVDVLVVSAAGASRPETADRFTYTG